MKNKEQLRSAEKILKDFIRKETEYLQSCNPTNELGEITGNDFAAGLVRGMNKVLEEYAQQTLELHKWEGVGQKEAFTLEDMKAAFEAGRITDSWSNEIGWITHHTFEDWIKTRKK